MSNYVFVDCEGHGPAAGLNDHSKFEFGAVVKVHPTQVAVLEPLCGGWDFLAEGRKVEMKVFDHFLGGLPADVASFHGVGGHESVFQDFGKWLTTLINGVGRPIFISDNPAYDWQFINYYFHKFLGANPFGHSARRISDYYAGLRGDFSKTQEWKGLRRTNHDHHPVHDALGNLEAFCEIQRRVSERAAEGLGEFEAFLRVLTR